MKQRDREKQKLYAREYIKRDYVKAARKEYALNNKNKQPGYSEVWANKNPESYLLSAAKQRAKKRNIEFSITKESFKVPTHCPILGIGLQINRQKGSGGKSNSPSLDRIDNSKGYVEGNIQVISHLANSMKSTATKEQLMKFAEWIIKTNV